MARYSICIPTRERHGTLKSSIETVLAQTYRDFELVVQDNCSSAATEEVVRGFNDPRIVYHRADRRLAMHDNWEATLAHATGDYVLFLGDDDALMPDCLARADEIIRQEKPEILNWTVHMYYWPDVIDPIRRNHLSLDVRSGALWRDGFINEPEGTLTSAAHPNRPPGCIYFSSSALLRNWFNWGGARMYVPIYHNLISRALIDRVRKANNGKYFLHPIPDFASLVVNLYYSTEVLFYSRALSMTGHSGASNGGSHGSGKRYREIAATFFQEAGLTAEQILPTLFAPLPWGGNVLAGCFEWVKNAAFPKDKRFELNWPKFLVHVASEVNAQPPEERDECREWVIDSAKRVGVDPAKLQFVESPPWERRIGLYNDPLGRVFYINIDGDEVGLKTIMDAVSVAKSLAPCSDFMVEPPVQQTVMGRVGKPMIKRLLRI